MKIHNFIGDFSLRIGRFKLEDRELFNQIRKVLRLEIGEKITLCDGKMNEGAAEIKEFQKNYIEVEIKKVSINQNEPERQVILYCSILKRENFELVVQKATEVGVKEIVPLVADRTVKLNVRQDRLEKIIKEAAEQSGRGRVPILKEPINFKKALGDTKGNLFNLLFDRSGESFEELERLGNKRPIGIWIGPEGGWAEQEIELAGKSGFQIINLGNFTLRVETAAIIASYQIINNP